MLLLVAAVSAGAYQRSVRWRGEETNSAQRRRGQSLRATLRRQRLSLPSRRCSKRLATAAGRAGRRTVPVHACVVATPLRASTAARAHSVSRSCPASARADTERLRDTISACSQQKEQR